jgi:Zn-dependent peptidase ImmA (M78 family)
MSREEQLFQTIIKNLAIPVIEMSKTEMYEKYTSVVNPDAEWSYEKRCSGFYAPPTSRYRYEKWPKGFIFIDKNCALPYKLFILFHEVGHYLYHISNEPVLIDMVKQEEDAFIYMIQQCIIYELKTSLKKLKKYFDSCYKKDPLKENTVVHDAIENVMQTIIWQECLKIIKEQ